MLLVGVYAYSHFFGKHEPEDSTVQSAAIVPVFGPLKEVLPSLQDTIPKNNTRFKTHIVKPGDTFFGILLQYNISGDLCNKIYQSFSSLGFPKLHPGDSLVVSSCDKGVKDILFLSKKGHWFKACLDDSTITSEKKAVEMTTYIALVNGTLKTSLSEAMYRYGVSDIITGKFADIFAWDINFFLEPRKGDRFQIVFEQKYSEGRFHGYGEILAARYYSGTKVFTAYGRKTDSGVMQYFDENGKSLQKQFLKAPLRFSRISSGFTHKRKHPVLGIVRPHLGIDYAAPSGTPVLAAADGKITFAGRKGDYGNMVIVSHGGVYETYYGHLRSIGAKVKIGTHVTQGTIIGTVGATGLATGPHLDYRMKHHGAFVNPSSVQLPSQAKAEFSPEDAFYSTVMDERFRNSEGLHIVEINDTESTKVQVLTDKVILNPNGAFGDNESDS
ncbi:MAG: peptidoglycan DD-metalloendopeptidase family protein [Chitinispirillaceae bacterium]|nr:peptidoglycan DD-metalloendopeptidase family protein [Chitinispirillaceae bacterium]